MFENQKGSQYGWRSQARMRKKHLDLKGRKEPDHRRLSHRVKAFEMSVVVQSLRICLPMQQTWVQSLVWEYPTCQGAAKPMHHSYCPWALEPVPGSKKRHHGDKPTGCA